MLHISALLLIILVTIGTCFIHADTVHGQQQKHAKCRHFTKNTKLSALVASSVEYLKDALSASKSSTNNNNNNNNNGGNSASSVIMSLENTACDLSCESQLCSCMNTEFDPSALASSTLHFCKISAQSATNENMMSEVRSLSTDCMRNYKTCKETSLASSPEEGMLNSNNNNNEQIPAPHFQSQSDQQQKQIHQKAALAKCSRAATDLGFIISPESCANFACGVMSGVLGGNVASGTGVEEHMIDLATACNLYHKNDNNQGVNLQQQQQQQRSKDRNAAAQGDPLSDMISNLISSVLSSVVESIIESAGGGKQTTVATPAPPITTMAATTTTTTTTTPAPTNAPPVAPGQMLSPGLLQVKFNYTSASVAKSELEKAINDYLTSQASYLMESVPAGTKVTVTATPVSGNQYQLAFTVSGVSDKNQAAAISAAVAQQVSDAINVKSYKSDDLARLLTATGRRPVPSYSAGAAAYPTLPDPLTPPTPVTEELPIAAVAGGIIGGVIVGLAVGAGIAHYFCSKVETLPLKDRLMPAGDDDEDSDEEEEEDEDDGDDDDEDGDAVLGKKPSSSPSSPHGSRSLRPDGSQHKFANPSSPGVGGANHHGRQSSDMDLLNLANSSPKKNMSSPAYPRGGGGNNSNNRPSSSSRLDSNNNNNSGSREFSPRNGGSGSGNNNNNSSVNRASSGRPQPSSGNRGSGDRQPSYTNNGARSSSRR